jgi:membrane protease YdiL (CAAX protease family)
MLKRPLLAFFSLTFALTWSAWTAAALLVHAGIPALAALAGAVTLLGTFAPGLVALWLTQRWGGTAATATLFSRVIRGSVPARWYVFAVAYIPAVKLTAAVLHRVLTGAWPVFGATPWYLMALALVVSTWAQAGEEIGWRGFALPRMAGRIGLGPASVALGVIWACWHLPLFFMLGGDTRGQSFPLYLLQVTALSVALAFLYWRTGGSLLLVMLMHAAVNNTKDIVPSAVPGAHDSFTLTGSWIGWATVALLWLLAAGLLVAMRGVKRIPEGHDTAEAAG